MWLSKAKPEISLDGVEDITSIPEFMKTYQSTFFKTLEKIIKSEGVRPENIIFARDCSSQDVWRRLIFPDYKGIAIILIFVARLSSNGPMIIYCQSIHNLVPRLLDLTILKRMI
jgi:hypothetical protein